MIELIVLSHEGDTTITWDDNDPAACEEMRRTVADLAAKGYSFFLTDGRPADAVTAGGGTLIVRKLTAEEVIGRTEEEGRKAEETDSSSALDLPSSDLPAESDRKRKGRKGVPHKTIVATRPIAGGIC